MNTCSRWWTASLGAAFLVVSMLVLPCAAAAAFPSQPVRVVVPAPPGSVPDVHARKIADRLAQSLGQPVIVDNRPGATGMIAAEFAARARPDGYTVLLASNSMMAIAPVISTQARYRPLRDFVPVTGLVRGTPILLVHPRLPVRTVAELVAYAKARPGKLSYGSSGIGSVTHLAMEQFEDLHGLHMVHIPYRGAAEVLTDLVAGRIEVATEYQTVALPHLQSGRLRALAVAGGDRRVPALPEVPTAKELGMASFDGTGWLGFVVPAGTPPEVVDRLQREIAAAAQGPEYLAWVQGLGAELLLDSPAAFGRFLAMEVERWGRVARKAGVRLD